MRVGIVLLCLAYVISQFFRNFLAVLSEQLYLDIGATSDDLAFAMGFWFLTFSLMQIPVGTALDKIGPKLTGSFIFLLGGKQGGFKRYTASHTRVVEYISALVRLRSTQSFRCQKYCL